MLPLILIAALAESAIGQTAFPTKPLRFVAMSTGFPENTARALANEITPVIKQNIVIDPRPGANEFSYIVKDPTGFGIQLAGHPHCCEA